MLSYDYVRLGNKKRSIFESASWQRSPSAPLSRIDHGPGRDGARQPRPPPSPPLCRLSVHRMACQSLTGELGLWRRCPSDPLRSRDAFEKYFPVCMARQGSRWPERRKCTVCPPSLLRSDRDGPNNLTTVNRKVLNLRRSVGHTDENDRTITFYVHLPSIQGHDQRRIRM